MKAVKERKAFKKHAIDILEDRAKSHLLIEILNGLESNNPNVALPALHALSKVWVGKRLIKKFLKNSILLIFILFRSDKT